MGTSTFARKHFKQQKDLIAWLTNDIELRDRLDKLFKTNHMYAYFSVKHGGFWLDEDEAVESRRIVSIIEGLVRHRRENRQSPGWVEGMAFLRWQAGMLEDYTPPDTCPSSDEEWEKELTKDYNETVDFYLTQAIRLLKGELTLPSKGEVHDHA